MKGRGDIFILAASSSAMALLSRGIVPDLVLSTDGGPWALLHLYECLRGSAGKAAENGGTAAPIAAALSAALPSQCAQAPILGLSDNSFWQRLILQRLNIPHLPLPQRGTVSASAIDLALALGSGNIFIAGMDLAVRDIRTHVRPYSFDRLPAEKASRLNPVYSQAYVRSAGITGGKSHEIYAAWFRSRIKTYPDRIYTLGNNNQVFQSLKKWENLTTKNTPNLRAADTKGKKIRISPVNLPENPAGLAAAILKEALSDPRTKKPVMEELSALLFPGRTPEVAELADEIGILADPYCRAINGVTGG
jgi:hypothetical protein